MYAILFYDVNEFRVSKVMKVCRQYLIHVQNSVFEGDITVANLVALKEKIKRIIDSSIDSVIIYEFKFMDSKYVNRSILGIEKRTTDFIF